MDFEQSARSKDVQARVRRFIVEQVRPVEEKLLRDRQQSHHGGDWTKWAVPPEVDALKAKARAEGLWNLFLPDARLGGGLSVLRAVFDLLDIQQMRIAQGALRHGVLYELLRVGGISWETLLVCLGYPVYFVLRRSMGTGHLGGMWWEFACMLPFAIVVTVREFADGTVLAANPSLWWSAPAVSLFAAFASWQSTRRALTSSSSGPGGAAEGARTGAGTAPSWIARPITEAAALAHAAPSPWFMLLMEASRPSVVSETDSSAPPYHRSSRLMSSVIGPRAMSAA